MGERQNTILLSTKPESGSKKERLGSPEDIVLSRPSGGPHGAGRRLHSFLGFPTCSGLFSLRLW